MIEAVLFYLQAFSYLGLGLGGCVACITFFSISRRTMENQWNDSFRSVFSSFWEDDTLALARHLVDFTKEYEEKLKPVLIVINSSSTTGGDVHNVNLNDDQLSYIESIDRFGVAMLMIKFYRSKSRLGRRTLYDEIFVSNWTEQINKRPELVECISKYWSSLDNELNLARG